jgi:hypothetical protein
VIKRPLWLTVGFVGGVGVTVYAQARVRKLAHHYTPPVVVDRVTGNVRSLGRDLRDAVREGRTAMREREDELNADLRRGRRGPRPVRTRA